MPAAADGYYQKVDAQPVIDDVIEFVFDRQRAYYQEQGIEFDIVDAVAYNRPGLLYDCDRRIRALQEFQSHEAAAALAAANKRIANILKKQHDRRLASDEAAERSAEKETLSAAAGDARRKPARVCRR